jgi:hypothetical protein
MSEWVLILALNIVAPTPNEIRDVSITLLGGFSSKASCDTAGEQLAQRAIAVVGRARQQRGIQENTTLRMPALNYECVPVKK